MRWKPDGRAGIEDRRDENDKPNGPVERHNKGMAQWEKENYLRRTSNRPEVPLPPELTPAVRPGDGWGSVAPAPERPASDGWSAPAGPTNPIVDMTLSPEMLAKWRENLRNRLQLTPKYYAHPGMDRTYEEARQRHNAPIMQDLATSDRVKKSGLLERVATLRKIRRDAGEK